MCHAGGRLRITIVVVNPGIANFSSACVPEKILTLVSELTGVFRVYIVWSPVRRPRLRADDQKEDKTGRATQLYRRRKFISATQSRTCQPA